MLPLILETEFPFIFESQAPDTKVAFSFVMALTGRVKGLRLGEISEFLKDESTFRCT